MVMSTTEQKAMIAKPGLMTRSPDIRTTADIIITTNTSIIDHLPINYTKRNTRAVNRARFTL